MVVALPAADKARERVCPRRDGYDPYRAYNPYAMLNAARKFIGTNYNIYT
jgi:hypothetical protein